MQVCSAAMTRSAACLCKNADVSDRAARPPSADDLLVLLAVGRSGRYTTAADELGINHTTISRRIAALEQAIGGRVLTRAGSGWELTDLGREALAAAETVESAVRSVTATGMRQLEGVVRVSATDGFSAYIAAPAAAHVQRRHPRVTVEIVATTRRASLQRSSLDLEIVVGAPQVRRAEAIRLGDYRLGLYASREYLAEHGAPESVDALAAHPLVYFIDSMLQVDDLDIAAASVPAMRESVTSTNVFVHVEATRAAAGLGLLPCFMADRHDDLVRVLPDAVSAQLSYWLVARAETLRRPVVAAVVDAIRARMEDQRDMLLGGKAYPPG
ncbi:LysR family transcriptional regulator [Mycobacterium sp. 852013-50091_SCH5140682]|uniref:LysR family transcriptional regulator n=1 Tax=Mycobacterium sp. 852013-50091_SCH5140682 TaxID=1834109 RepID=UPI0007E92893|nr:LysR family transcriptional regulator [Mycobacterium sp. 852013-50091_SCH5140682]OBC04536.1 LysR family transcriptional regulator [Mycobacterium sp. 852013-50091_SCH5140682]